MPQEEGVEDLLKREAEGAGGRKTAITSAEEASAEEWSSLSKVLIFEDVTGPARGYETVNKEYRRVEKRRQTLSSLL